MILLAVKKLHHYGCFIAQTIILLGVLIFFKDFKSLFIGVPKINS